MVTSARIPRNWLIALLLGATVARLILGRVFFGFHTGDDVEIVEAGFLRVFGGSYQPWEIRNLLLSDLLVAPVLALASALGATSPRTLIWIASLPFVLLASLNGWLVYRLTHRWLGSERAALLASGLYLFHGLALGYGSMVESRVAATTCVLLAVLVLWDRGSERWRPFVAGGLMAVAWALRYSEVVFLLPLGAMVWLGDGSIRRRLGRCLGLALGFASVSLLTVVLEDGLTWGRPFASLAAFARYTLVERRSSSLEPHQAWFWYLWRCPKWLAPTLLPLLGWARQLPRAREVALLALLPLLALSLIHHKELRYLQGIVPFVLILAAAGAWVGWNRGGRRWVSGLVAASLLLGVGSASFLARKSMAAVVVAERIAAQPVTGTACLSQSWAYGGTLYLREASIQDLPSPLTAAALEPVLGRCDEVALYARDARRDPALPALLARRGYPAAGEERWGHSPAVLWFRRAPSGSGNPGRP